MKVVYALCGLVGLLQAACIDAQDGGEWTTMTPLGEPLNTAETLEPTEPEPIPVIVPPPTLLDPETFVPSWNDLHPPGWNGAGIPPDDLNKPQPSGIDGPDPFNQDPALYEPTWDELHPPGLNGDGRPPGYWEEYWKAQQPIAEEGPVMYEPEPLPYEPSWEDLHPPGLNGDGRPPEYWEEYWKAQQPIAEEGPVMYEPEPLPYEPSWEDLHPPGWNGDGRPPGYWEEYWQTEQPMPEYGPMVIEEVPTWNEPSWEDLHPPGWNGGEGDGVPPWLLNGGDVPQPYGVTGDTDLPLWLSAQVLGTEVYIPSAATIPGFTAVDTDGDHLASPSEWSSFSQKLHDAAAAKTANVRDRKGKDMLDAIIAFHYENLNACLLQNAPPAVSQEGYEHTSAELAAKCNVKFRYSLFAGPAPFEWIARKDLTITSEKLTTWFATQLANAIDDIKNARVRPQFAEVLPFAKNTLACLSHMLSSQNIETLDRSAYYKVVDAALACGESESH